MESRLLNARGIKIGSISLYFSLLTGILGRDGFARDCIHRQTVCGSENGSLIYAKMPVSI